MNSRFASRALAAALALALLSGILVAWTPRYWPNTVATAALAVVALLWALLADRVSLPFQTVIVLPLALWGTVQGLLGMPVVASLAGRQSLFWLTALIAFVLGSQILKRTRDRAVFLEIMLWAATGLAVEAIFQAVFSPGKVFGLFPVPSWVVGTLYYKNHFAAMMELAAPIALWKVLNDKIISGGACFAVMLAATVTSASRAGSVILVAELIAFLLVAVFSRRLALQSGIAMIATLLAMSAAASAVVGPGLVWDRLNEQNPYFLRAQFAESTWRMVSERPLTGYGMGTWRAVYPRFATLDMAVIANEAHNDWAQWAAEAGLPFAALMAALALWLAAPAVRSVWGLGLLAVLAHAWVDYPTRQLSLQLWWFVLAGAIAARPGAVADH